MARIRSIKPDFFTSETIARLPLSARLTFIGLWTYVDDNGVGLDNELLITAAVWPLERDNLETLARTREDLASLSREGLVSRYRDSRKRYLHVTSWKEHQKVDHPGKPRYPQPTDPAVTDALTSQNGAGTGILASPSRECRESVAPEQGAGSREQGEQHPPRREPKIEPGSDQDPDFTAFWDAYPRKVGKGQARPEWRAALKRKADPKAIILGAERYRDDPARKAKPIDKTCHPSTWLHGERYNDLPESGEVLEYPTSPWEN